MKVVINGCHGGFGLSEAACFRYAELSGFTLYAEKDNKYTSFTNYWKVPADQRPKPLPEPWIKNSEKKRVAYNQAHKEAIFYDRDIARDDKALVQVVEEMGNAASGKYARLEIVEIPDDVEWEIEEYDGSEWVSEKHRRWG